MYNIYVKYIVCKVYKSVSVKYFGVSIIYIICVCILCEYKYLCVCFFSLFSVYEICMCVIYYMY